MTFKSLPETRNNVKPEGDSGLYPLVEDTEYRIAFNVKYSPLGWILGVADIIPSLYFD